jgi:hypothetical protein
MTSSKQRGRTALSLHRLSQRRDRRRAQCALAGRRTVASESTDCAVATGQWAAQGGTGRHREQCTRGSGATPACVSPKQPKSKQSRTRPAQGAVGRLRPLQGTVHTLESTDCRGRVFELKWLSFLVLSRVDRRLHDDLRKIHSHLTAPRFDLHRRLQPFKGAGRSALARMMTHDRSRICPPLPPPKGTRRSALAS